MYQKQSDEGELYASVKIATYVVSGEIMQNPDKIK